MTVNFRQGSSYRITITAARTLASQQGANVLLRTDLNSGLGGGNNQCNGTGVIDANGSGNLKQSLQVGNSNFNGSDTNYVFNYVALSAPQTYLLIAAVPPSGSQYQTIHIRRIKIEETGTPELVLSPTSLAVTCGTTVAQTFTVSNPNNVTGITSYEWNLGSSSNGWLYNGTAAPQNISTTTNSLSLTPVCGSSLSNVSVTVRVNNQNYKTYTATISTTAPTMSINGSASFCSGTSTYSVNNLPCNASVTWSLSQSGIVSPSCTTRNSTTLTKVGNGQVTLTATITACGVQMVRNLTIDVGTPEAPQFIEIYGNGATDPMSLCPGGYRAEAFTFTASPQYEWRLPDE